MMKKWFVLLVSFTGLVSLGAVAAPVERWELNNGVKVLFVENHSLPMLDVRVLFDAGAARDPSGKAGLAGMTGTMLTRGTTAVAGQPARTETQVLDGFADIGARFSVDVSRDAASATLRVLSARQEREAALSLMAHVLAHPAFPQQALDRDKARAVAQLQDDAHQPGPVASRAFWQAMYGKHPYGAQESVQSVSKLSRQELVDFHRRHFVTTGAVVAIIGDLRRDEADKVARQLTAGLPAGQALPALPAVTLPKGTEERIANPASQSHIMIGMPSVARNDPDTFALVVGNYVLGGGGFVSRLMEEVREKRGLVYGIGSGFAFMRALGPFQIRLQTQHSQTEEALKVTRQVLHDFLANGPTDAEMQAAKDNLVGSFPLNIDSNGDILEYLSMIGWYGLPLDYLDTWTQNVASVTKEQVRAAFARKVHENQLVTVIVGQGK